MNRSSAAHPLVERDAQLDAIVAAVDRARAGQGSLTVVRGEPGIGRTALLRVVEQQLREARIPVVRHRGTDVVDERPYGALLEFLGPQLRERFADPADAQPVAEPVIELLRSGRVEHPSELLHTVSHLTLTLVCERSMVVLADDAQDFDSWTLRVLVFVATHLADRSAAVVVAVRSNLVDQAADLRSLVASADQDIELAPLTPSGVEQMLGATSGSGPTSDVVESVCERSGGLPLYVRGVMSGPGDDGMARAVRARLDSCGPAARQVADAVAVLDAHATIPMIRDVADLSNDEVARGVDELVDAWLLDPVSGVQFRYAAVRDAVAAMLLPGRRAELDVRAARCWGIAHPERSAAHVQAAATTVPIGEDWVVPVLTAAAAAAERQGRLREAITMLRRSLREPVESVESVRIRRRIGTLLDHLGDRSSLDELTRSTEDSSDPNDRAQGSLALVTALMRRGRLAEAIDLADEWLSLPHGSVELELYREFEAAWLNAKLLLGQGPVERTAGAQSADETDRTLLAHNAAEAVSTGSVDAPSTARIALDALGTARGGVVEASSPVAIQAIVALTWSGAVDEATSAVEEAAERAARSGSWQDAMFASALASNISWYRGDVLLAARQSSRVLDSATAADPMCFVVAAAAAVEVGIEREESVETWAWLTSSGLSGELGEPATVNALLAGRTRLRLSLGDTAGAVADATELRDRALRANHHNPACAPWRSLLATALMRDGGAPEEAHRLCDDEVALAEAFGAPRPLGVALLARADLHSAAGRRADDLTRACEVLRDSGARLQHATALVEAGACAALGSPDRRRELLHSGLTEANRCGSDRLVTLAVDRLAELGEQVSRPRPPGAEGLTDQERRVVEHVLDGLSNGEVARTMYLTRRTVEFHLTNVYRKLGIGSRSELAAALEQAR